ARSVQDLVYKHELEEWNNRPDVNLFTTVDPGGETPDWKGKVGFVPTILKEISPSSENTIAAVCGPPIMIKLTLPVLFELGFKEENIFTTLENRMKCGIGKCGHCAVGPYYVCKDGPVITYKELKELPQEY
ncbi:MAG TPA: heterodisulfide reductase subunit F, partial [Candidatus Kapabacteria bacterium]|nr:heterodisulfide reductase subunit F [Candidatus Kapabacteria bacterium]